MAVVLCLLALISGHGAAAQAINLPPGGLCGMQNLIEFDEPSNTSAVNIKLLHTVRRSLYIGLDGSDLIQLDCSCIVDNLTIDFPTAMTIDVSWSLQLLQANRTNSPSITFLTGAMPGITISADTAVLTITNPTFDIGDAAQLSGLYTCTTCANFAGAEAPVCRDGELQLGGPRPMIREGAPNAPGRVSSFPSFLEYDIGTNFCVNPDTNDPTYLGVAVSCENDNSLAPEAVGSMAELTINGMPIGDVANTLFSIRTNVIAWTFVDSVVGMLTCALSNDFGSDTATSIVIVCVSCVPPLIDAASVSEVGSNVTIGGIGCLVGGASVVLNCPLVEGTDPMYEWREDGVVIPGETSANITITGMAAYTCAVSNTCGNDSAVSTVTEKLINTDEGFVATVSGAEFAIGLSTCSQTAPQWTITCMINGSSLLADVHVWTRDGTELLGQTGPQLILAANTDKEGTYVCNATSSCGSIFATSILYGNPVIRQGTSVQPIDTAIRNTIEIGDTVCLNTDIGGNVVLLCELSSGATDVNITWSKVEDPSFFATGTSITLPIDPATTKGTYTCLASRADPLSVCGNDTASSVLRNRASLTDSGMTVVGPNIVIGENTCLIPSVPTIIDCTPTLGAGPFEYVWTRDGTLLAGENSVTLSVTEAGVYECVVTDACLSDDADSIVASIPVPIIQMSSSSPCIASTESIILRCSDSSPNTAYVWTSDPPILIPSPTNVLLSVLYSNLASDTTFTCTASDPLCTDSGVANVTLYITVVLEVAQEVFQPSPVSNTLVIGESTCLSGGGFNISCDVTGSPTAYTWYRNGAVIVNETDSILSDIQSEGMYECEAENTCSVARGASRVFGIPTVTMGTGSVDVVGDGGAMVGVSLCVDTSQGGTFTITCSTPSLNTTTTWTKDNDPSFMSSDTSIDISVSDTGVAGTYTCTVGRTGASSVCGEATASSVVDVLAGFDSTNTIVDSDIINIGDRFCFTRDVTIDCLPSMGTGPFTYQWSTGATASSILVTNPGTYTCTVSSTCGGMAKSVSATSDIIAPLNVTFNGVITGVSDSGCGRVNGTDAYDLCLKAREELTLSCSVSPSGVDYTIMGPGGSTSNQDLVLSNFTEGVAGTYTCAASNPCSDLMELIDVGFIVVGTAPTVSLPPDVPTLSPPTAPPSGDVPIGQDVCVAQGETVQLNCEVEGGSLPLTFVWLLEGVVIDNATSTRLDVTMGGRYTCTVSNFFGSSSAHSNVYVMVMLDLMVTSVGGDQCEQQVVPLPQGVDQCVFVGDDVTVTCMASDGSAVQLLPGGVGGVAVLDDIQSIPGNIINFMCSVNSTCSDVSAMLSLAVYQPAIVDTISLLPAPSLLLGVVLGVGRNDESVPVTRNTTLEIHCPYMGVDSPTVEWVYIDPRTGVEEVVVNSPPDIVISNINNTLVLVIRSFVEADAGLYRCNVANVAGNDNAEILLRFDDPEPTDWETTPWSACNPLCHRGIRTRLVTCYGQRSRLPRPDNLCLTNKPSTWEQCRNLGPCFLDPVWDFNNWTPCNRACGGGTRWRYVFCVIPATREIRPNWECAGLTPPSSYETCNTEPCCTDQYGSYCRSIAGTSLCLTSSYQRYCCWSCSQHGY